MTSFRYSIDMGRLWIFLFQETEELESPEDLPSSGTNMQTRPRRLLIDLMGEMLMEEISWCSLPNTVQMQKQFRKEGLLPRVQSRGAGLGVARHRGLGIGNTGSGVEAVTSLRGAVIEKRIGIIVEVPVLAALRVAAEAD